MLAQNLPTLEHAKQIVMELRHALKYFAVAEHAARVVQRAYRTRMARALMAHLKAQRQVLSASAAYRQEAAARRSKNPRTAWLEENKRRAAEQAKQAREWVLYNREQELEGLRWACTKWGWEELYTEPTEEAPYGTPYFYNKVRCCYRAHTGPSHLMREAMLACGF